MGWGINLPHRDMKPWQGGNIARDTEKKPPSINIDFKWALTQSVEHLSKNMFATLSSIEFADFRIPVNELFRTLFELCHQMVQETIERVLTYTDCYKTTPSIPDNKCLILRYKKWALLGPLQWIYLVVLTKTPGSTARNPFLTHALLVEMNLLESFRGLKNHLKWPLVVGQVIWLFQLLD